MSTIHFLGNVVPTSYNIVLVGLPKTHYHSPEFGIDVDIDLKIQDSSVDVECTMTHFDMDHLSNIHKVAFDLARAAVHLLAFASGITLAVVFNKFTDPNGVTSPFVIQHPDLAKLCTAFSLVPNGVNWNIGDAANVVFTEPLLFAALDDLIGAVSHHHLTTVNCARAIEALRTLTAKPGMSRKDAWEHFRSSLQINEDYLRVITDNSTDGRHGGGTFVPGAITSVIVQRSWTIVNRFLEFRKRGSLQLPESEFPMLSA